MVQSLTQTKTTAARASLARRLLRCMGIYLQLSRERQALQRLEERQLKDIGLDRGQRDAMAKSRWNAPDHWHRSG